MFFFASPQRGKGRGVAPWSQMDKLGFFFISQEQAKHLLFSSMLEKVGVSVEGRPNFRIRLQKLRNLLFSQVDINIVKIPTQVSIHLIHTVYEQKEWDGLLSVVLFRITWDILRSLNKGYSLNICIYWVYSTGVKSKQITQGERSPITSLMVTDLLHTHKHTPHPPRP